MFVYSSGPNGGIRSRGTDGSQIYKRLLSAEEKHSVRKSCFLFALRPDESTRAHTHSGPFEQCVFSSLSPAAQR